MSTIIEFYRGDKPDYKDRMLADLWAYDLERFEDDHDYIQVLFPNERPSMFNARAPLLDAATIAAFRADEGLRANLARSLDVMLRFYGLQYDAAAGKVKRRDDFTERARDWLSLGDHNHLRITRILKCLTALGLADRAFLDALDEVRRDYPERIDPDTWRYWTDAVR